MAGQNKPITRSRNHNGREEIMDTKKMYECGLCYFQGIAKDFSPITVSANFAALECPKCLSIDVDSFTKMKAVEAKLATEQAA